MATTAARAVAALVLEVMLAKAETAGTLARQQGRPEREAVVVAAAEHAMVGVLDFWGKALMAQQVIM